MFLTVIYAELISSVTDSNNLAGFARPLLFPEHHAKVLKKCDLRQSVFWSVNVLGTGGWGTSDVTSHVPNMGESAQADHQGNLRYYDN